MTDPLRMLEPDCVTSARVRAAIEQELVALQAHEPSIAAFEAMKAQRDALRARVEALEKVVRDVLGCFDFEDGACYIEVEDTHGWGLALVAPEIAVTVLSSLMTLGETPTPGGEDDGT